MSDNPYAVDKSVDGQSDSLDNLKSSMLAVSFLTASFVSAVVAAFVIMRWHNIVGRPDRIGIVTAILTVLYILYAYVFRRLRIRSRIRRAMNSNEPNFQPVDRLKRIAEKCSKEHRNRCVATTIIAVVNLYLGPLDQLRVLPVVGVMILLLLLVTDMQSRNILKKLSERKSELGCELMHSGSI